jgi:hypothetical protein
MAEGNHISIEKSLQKEIFRLAQDPDDGWSSNSGSTINLVKNKESLIIFLRNYKHLYPELRCSSCIDFFDTTYFRNKSWNKNWDDAKIAKNIAKKRRSTGWSWDFNAKMGLICRIHKKELLPITFFEKCFAKKLEVENKYNSREKPYSIIKRNRKCIGIHPHCSICGMCHTNRRTHDRGHPRY